MSIYYSPEQAREIVRRTRVVVEFMPGVGARCPLCGDWGNELYKCVKQLATGVKRRYHQCPTCGYKFTSDVVRVEISGESYGNTSP